ncbi:5-bromo-4-chloroindolyl phosphate hydrolysis family protein [Porcipelethomonas sp.]|uniref:5-bromo-4-chloroindolyl phosphate hydrolysis family protein n=1 Tax=Porcipelethomonas sp. TaxID=2981675 RepID=UPI003EFA2165
MEKYKKKELAAGLLAGLLAGGLFLALLFLFHWNFIVDMVLSISAFFGLSLLLKPKLKIGKISIDTLPEGETISRQLEEAQKDFHCIEQAMEQIHEPAVRQETQRLKETAKNILEYLEKHPEKIRSARQFIDYYQETASSLLKKYIELQDTQLRTDDVIQLQNNTLKAIGTLNTAFEEQFQKLMRSEMIDMEAEIRLLEQTVKMENGI